MDFSCEFTIFHVEVPLEEQPNYKYGHLFPFHSGDLEQMLRAVGFEVFSITQHESLGFHGKYRYARAIAIKCGEEILSSVEEYLATAAVRKVGTRPPNLGEIKQNEF